MSYLPDRSGKGATAQISQYSHRIFSDLFGKFNDNILREIVLASAGVKASRTCMDSADLEIFLPTAERNNLKVVISQDKYVHRKDIGKGGWSNSVERVVARGSTEGLFNVYIASDARLAEVGLSAEELSNEETFGLLLGVPACCVEAYLRFHPVAQLKQNDFVPLVLESTNGPPPYSYWNNFVSQYFGRSLLSFFPCSFNCPHAAHFAKETFFLIRQCSSAWAEGFVRSQQTNILYTEYLGLHLLTESHYKDGWITYDARLVQSTEATEITERLRRGDKLRVLGKREVEIYDGKRLICKIGGEDVSLCVFN